MLAFEVELFFDREVQHQEVVRGRRDQVLFFDPPDGKPDLDPIPRVVVFASQRRVPATIGACSIDPVDTRLFGDVYAGRRWIRVTDPSGIVPGRGYLMAHPEGEREWIVVDAVDDDRLDLRHPLVHRYAGAATIVGCRISIAVDPAWADDLANLSEASGSNTGLGRYTLRWSYSFHQVEMSGISFADVVTCAADELVTCEDVERRHPGWLDALPPDQRESEGASYIEEAARVIRIEAVGDAHAQRRILDRHVLHELIDRRANMLRLETEVMYGTRCLDELELAERRYHELYAKLVGVPSPTDTTRPKRQNKSSASVRIPKFTF